MEFVEYQVPRLGKLRAQLFPAAQLAYRILDSSCGFRLINLNPHRAYLVKASLNDFLNGFSKMRMINTLVGLSNFENIFWWKIQSKKLI